MKNSTLEMVRAMWNAGLAQVEAERRINKAMPLDTFFAKLEAVVEGIKAHLIKHDLMGPCTFLVKHGDSTVTVLADFPGLAVVRDPEDPTRPLFHLPATQILGDE